MSGTSAETGSTRVLVPVADGSEEMEVVIVVDVLRRAGMHVVLASPGGVGVTCSRGVGLVPNADLDQVLSEEWDAIVVPGGGPGTDRLVAHKDLGLRLAEMANAGRLVAAICAGPKVLANSGLLFGRSFTCHPGVRDELPAASSQRVVQDGNVITSQGPGTAMEFALAVVEALNGREIAEKVAGPLMLP